MTDQPNKGELPPGQKEGELPRGCCLLLVLSVAGEIVQFVVVKDAWLEWMDDVARWVGCPLWLAITGYFFALAAILALLAGLVSWLGKVKSD